MKKATMSVLSMVLLSSCAGTRTQQSQDPSYTCVPVGAVTLDEMGSLKELVTNSECRDGNGQLERRTITTTTTTTDTTGQITTLTVTVEDELYYGNGQLRQRRTESEVVSLDLDSVLKRQNHGPFESYLENGQLVSKGTYNMGEKCGEWFEDGETETHPPPCPPGLEDGN